MKVRGRLDRNYIKTIGSLHFYTKFHIYFPKNLKMHFSKALLYDTIFVAQMFTTLVAPSIANPLYDANGKSSSKSNDSFANEAKDLKTQVKGEIDEQSKKRQV